jgi:hypothetical protein
MAGVSFPVNVFCWDGWNVPSNVTGPASYSAPCAKRGLGRGTGSPNTGSARRAASQP